MAFSGFQVPLEAAEQLAKVDVLGKPNPPATMHITLHYFGENKAGLDPVQLGKITKIMTEVGRNFKPFPIEVSRASFFPSDEDIPCICRIHKGKWQKGKGDESGGRPPGSCPLLYVLKSELDEKFDAAGVEYSKKYPEYKPHVTLSYVPEGTKGLKKISFKPVKWEATSMVLWDGPIGEKDQMHAAFPLLPPSHDLHYMAKLHIARIIEANRFEPPRVTFPPKGISPQALPTWKYVLTTYSAVVFASSNTGDQWARAIDLLIRACTFRDIEPWE